MFKDLEQSIISRGKHKCKAFEGGEILSCSKNRKKARMSGILWSAGERQVNKRETHIRAIHVRRCQ